MYLKHQWSRRPTNQNIAVRSAKLQNIGSMQSCRSLPVPSAQEVVTAWGPLCKVTPGYPLVRPMLRPLETLKINGLELRAVVSTCGARRHVSVKHDKDKFQRTQLLQQRHPALATTTESFCPKCLFLKWLASSANIGCSKCSTQAISIKIWNPEAYMEFTEDLRMRQSYPCLPYRKGVKEPW